MEFVVRQESEKIDVKPKLVRNKKNEIDYYKERIQYYQELIDKLGDNEEITERVIRLEKKLSYLLN